MQKLIIFSAIMALAAAAPGYILTHQPQKSTITHSSQVVDHGSTTIHHVPVVHATSVVHAPLVHVSVPAKTTVTKSNQVVNHGATLHLPVVHTHEVPVLHTQKTTVTKNIHAIDHGSTYVHTPVVVSAPVLHTAVVHSSPLVTFKTGDSAVSHHSSTVHETVPVVKSYSLYAIHH